MNSNFRKKRLGSSMALALPWMLSGCGAATPEASVQIEQPTEQQSQALTVNTNYRIVSMWDGQVVDVGGCSNSDGAVVDQWGYWRGSCQQWQLQSSLGGYRFVGVASGRCLDVPGGSTATGAGMELWDCLNNTVQAWTLNQQADGSYTIVNKNSNLCLEIPGMSVTPAQGLDQWTCNGGTNQEWRLEPVNSNGVPTFGNSVIHPQKLGFYMIPDFWNEYSANWSQLQTSLNLLHTLLPNAWVRWDNETGHNNTWTYGDNESTVDMFLGMSHTANIPMIVSLDAVNGYNNYWAMNPMGTPVYGMRDFANSGYIAWSVSELNKYSNVQMLETANEADTSWFVDDADNSSDFDYYMNTVNASISQSGGKVLGPATSQTKGNIWTDWMNRGISNLSYHNYNGAAGLQDFSGKQVYVTEYGPPGSGNLDPGLLLSDLWSAEQGGHLSNTIQRIFYQQLLDNSTTGRGRGAINSQATEGSHFAFRDYLRALIAYQAQASTNAMIFPSGNDFVATDDGNGNTSVLAWNNSTSTESGRYIFVPGTTVGTAATLYVTLIQPGDSGVIQCASYGSQSWVTFAIGKSTDGNSPAAEVGLTVNSLPAHSAVMVSTLNCSSLTQ